MILKVSSKLDDSVIRRGKQGSFTHKRTNHLFGDGKKIPEWLGWYKYPNRTENQNMFEDHLSNQCYCTRISTTYCIWKILIHCKTALFYKSFGSTCKPCTKKTFTREIEQSVLLWATNHSAYIHVREIYLV